jgi:glycosyltransferase involved in cell wall biosynthesis
MKKVAVLLNTNQLGGAERSLLLQLGNNLNCQYTFFIPKLPLAGNIESEVKNRSLGAVEYYHYPPALYGLSRTGSLFSIKAIINIFQCLFERNVFKNIKDYDQVYLNGNKVAFLFLIVNLVDRFNGKIIWHLRDYFNNSKITNFLWSILTFNCYRQLQFVCNSESVKENLSSLYWVKSKVEVIYNPSGELPMRQKEKDFSKLGFVSMMAPWKGVHEIIFWAAMYENELMNLGIKEINIYGENIYQTSGEHSNYSEELIKLISKLKPKLINFKGFKSPEQIFSEIDCLIHYSLRPEPFGRVIIEAYEAGIPVITTGLGGANELVDNGINAYKVQVYDRSGLFECVRELSSDNVLRFNFIERSKIKSRKIQENISNKMNKLFIEDKVS